MSEQAYLKYDPDEIYKAGMMAYIEHGGDILYPGDEKEMMLMTDVSIAVMVLASVENRIRSRSLRHAKGVHLEEFGEERSAVFVDIFPLDCFPDLSPQELVKYQKKILVIDNLCSLCNYRKGQGAGIKKIIYTVLLLLHKMLGCNRMKKFYENRLIKLTKYRDNGVLCDTEGGIGYSHFFKASQWGKMIKLPFEGSMFSVPENYDAVLTACYGDYMKLPPEDQRHSHEYYQMYWR